MVQKASAEMEKPTVANREGVYRPILCNFEYGDAADPFIELCRHLMVSDASNIDVCINSSSSFLSDHLPNIVIGVLSYIVNLASEANPQHTRSISVINSLYNITNERLWTCTMHLIPKLANAMDNNAKLR